MEEKLFGEMKYLVSYPDGFCENKKYPLVIFFHGRGARGESTERLHNYSCIADLKKHQNERGFVLLAPHCSRGTWSEWMASVIELVDSFRKLPYIDITRVYITGNSMGGYGTWSIATLRADWFAAAMPICGGGIAGLAGEIGKLPIRTFHGLCDKTVDPIESLQMAKAVNQAGGHAEMILFPELPHNCWEAAYSDEKNYDWMFSFTNER